MTGFFDQLARWLGGPSPTAETTPPVAPPPASSIVQADDPRLPDTTRPRVARLLALIADMEARGGRDTLLATPLTEIRQMRDSHLPQLVTSYAEIPPTHRAEIFRETGRSASYNLDAALDRMIARVESISRSMAQDDLDSFADNIRFIEQRYGGSGGD